MKIKTCGECDLFKASEEMHEINEPVKGNCYLNPPTVTVITTPTQDMAGNMNLQVNNIQTRPIVSADDKACGQAMFIA